jgi:nucleotide-binding universal stress UspA family protein
MTGRIVVGVDGSEGSRAALLWAVEEANRRQARLDVVLAYRRPIDEFPPLYISPSDQDLYTGARQHLDDLIADAGAGARTDRSMCRLAIPGAAAPTLLETAKDADLLVLGARGLGSFTGMLLGSVSQRCAASAACPVVIVRSADEQ